MHFYFQRRGSSMLTLVQSDNDRAGDDVLIHIRHWADGSVTTIDRRPAQLTAKEWRNLLLTEASAYLQPFANGRNFFRLPRPVYDGLLAKVTPLAAE
jgi:hydrogenase maturation factor